MKGGSKPLANVEIKGRITKLFVNFGTLPVEIHKEKRYMISLCGIL